MNFKQVEAFRAVMLSGSMTSAAEALHTSQPNISRLIGQLERLNGFALFERIGTRLVPTDEGTAFFNEVDRAFIGLRNLERSAQHIRQLGTGQMRIAAVPSLSLTLLPRAIQRFRQDHKQVAISLHTSDSTTIARWVASQFCDFGLVSFVGEDTPREQAQLIGDLAGVCIFPRNHHRLALLERIGVDDLAGEEFVSLAHDDGTRQRIDRFFQQHGDRRKLSLEAPYAATICSMVGAGLGVSIVSPLVARDYLHTGIGIRPFAANLRFTSYLLRPDNRPQSTLGARFAVLLQQMFQEEAEGSVAIETGS
ncbi:LysR substrate-binding domain-containing protein [Stutzerimonas azotifigens]|uniref:LysR family transcriptional regulator n=1 Tax=Stutzerimonas azotifigens TaxID=291995 RepID=A0ABR5Z7G7_9GAMM|nr:LysR substrate-binding domain-containing protein [Stutzerimonas azotifigens]MBA1276052.1 LysR family transcriptional regulator [Stutzerimonas azotifigens]